MRKMDDMFSNPIREDEDIRRNSRGNFVPKGSTRRAVVMTSIIFFMIIIIIVTVYSESIELLRNSIGEEVYRVVATRDIEPGEKITFKNVDRIIVQDALEIDGTVYRLNKEDSRLEFVNKPMNEYDFNVDVSDDDGRWAIGRIVKEKIYKGEILLTQRLEELSN